MPDGKATTSRDIGTLEAEINSLGNSLSMLVTIDRNLNEVLARLTNDDGDPEEPEQEETKGLIDRLAKTRTGIDTMTARLERKVQQLNSAA